MSLSLLLHWHYLVFLVPFCVGALLLLLSSLRLGHHHGGHGGHGHAVGHAGPIHAGAGHASASAHSSAGTHGGAAHGPAHTAPHQAGRHVGGQARHHAQASKTAGKAAAQQPNVILALLGVGRAPLPMVIQAFCLVWGLSGIIAVQQLLRDNPSPSLAQALPAMGIAAGCGLVGARLVSELIARLMPEDETSVVSRNGLYGLKGSVAFPVTETGGRIMVYDDFGSLHDESCRVAPGHPPIDRGRKVLVMDCDARGNLLVEEIAE